MAWNSNTYISVILKAAAEGRTGNDFRTSWRRQTTAVAEQSQPLMHTSSESVVTSPVIVIWCERAPLDASSSSSSISVRRIITTQRDLMMSRHSRPCAIRVHGADKQKKSIKKCTKTTTAKWKTNFRLRNSDEFTKKIDSFLASFLEYAQHKRPLSRTLFFLAIAKIFSGSSQQPKNEKNDVFIKRKMKFFTCSE